MSAFAQIKPRLARLALALAALALTVAALAPAAPAATKRVINTVGNPETGFLGGQFNLDIGSIAVNRSGAGGVPPGSVYVAQRGRVNQLGPGGEFLRAWGIDVVFGNPEDGFEICTVAGNCKPAGVTDPSSPHPGEVRAPHGIAVDQASGHLYVADLGSRRISVFSATGQPQGAFGWGVRDGASELQFCTVESGCQVGLDPPGAPGGELRIGENVDGLAVSPSGEIHFGPGSNRVDVFAPIIGGATVTDVAFRRAFGHDVVRTGPGDSAVDERSRLTVRATGGVLSLIADGRSTRQSGRGDLTAGSATVENVDPFSGGAGFAVGQAIVGSGIAAGTTITAVGTDTLTLSQAATGTATGVFLAAGLPPTATAAKVEAALNDVLASVGGSVTVTGGPGDETGSSPYELEFGGALAGDDVNFTAEGIQLTGGSPSSEAVVETLQEGGAFETCVPADGDACKAGSTGSGLGQFRVSFEAQGPGDLAFDPAGNLYALEEGQSTSERQIVTVDATGGSYTLSFEGQTTDPLPHSADAATVQKALEGLPTIGSGNVEVSNSGGGGIRRRVEFRNALAATDVPELACEGSSLSGDDPAEPGTGPGCGVETVRAASIDRQPRIQRFDSSDAPLSDDFGTAALLAALGPDADGKYLDTDPDTGNLLLAASGVDSAGFMRVAELDAAGDLADLHGPDLPVYSTLGIAAAPKAAGGTINLLTHSLGTLDGYYVLGPAKPQIEPPVCGPTSADLSGTVFSDGEQVFYRFEYVTESEFQASGFAGASRVPEPDALVGGSGEGAVPVAQQATGLTGSQPYRFRLVARRGVLVLASDAVACTTDPAPPAVSAAGVAVDETAAILKARLNPQNEAASYHFQYTTEADFTVNGWTNASRAPEADEAPVPAAARPLLVAQEIFGLEPGTAYRARILAANATGLSVGAEQAFTTVLPFQDPRCPTTELRGGPSAHLPDCRAYELVSPPGASSLGGTFGFAAPGGEAAGFSAFTALEGALQNTFNPYVAHRGASGWQTTATSTAVSERTAPPNPASNFHSFTVALSEDFTRSYVASRYSPDPRDTNQDDDLYLREPDGSFHWVSNPFADPACEFSSSQTFAGLSADGSHAMFFSGPLCESVDGGPARQVAVLPGGGLCPAPLAGSSSGGAFAQGTSHRAVSADGRRIFFGCEGALYVREDGATTTEIAAPGVFSSASRDGSAVLFTSTAPLVPGDANGAADLYRYDLDSATYTRLTIDSLTGGPDPRVRSGLSGGVVASEDGSRIYFVARGVLTEEPNANGQSATEGIDNVYVSDRGTLRFVASPQTATAITPALHVRGVAGSTSGSAIWDITPDGAHLAFATMDPLLGADTDASLDTYLYDLATEEIELATVGPRGGGEFAAWMGTGFLAHNAYTPRLLSADGRFLFFQTDEPLARRDVNDKVDVYERDLQTGQTWLISSGTTSFDAMLFGASRDGSSVFFIDAAQLAPHDPDSEPSLYVARVGGGFPPPVSNPCLGEACRGAQPGLPETPPASSRFFGPGNVTPRDSARPNRCARLARAVSRHGKRATRTRRAASRLTRAGKRARATAMRRRARRFARVAKRQSKRAKRCRARARGQARANRRAAR